MHLKKETTYFLPQNKMRDTQVNTAKERRLHTVSSIKMLRVHSQRRRVWKEQEKKHLTPAMVQEWEEGNIFFPDAFSVF